MEGVFERIGFASAESAIGTLFILVIFLFVICFALIIGIITLLVRKKDFSKNITGITQVQRAVKKGTGRPVMSVSDERIQMLEQRQADLTVNIDDIYRKIGSSYQKIGIVKYNAYSDMSGNISFVIAMLDGNDSGFILNVINGREGSNTYIKDITEGKSNERLGAEEMKALKLALT